MSGQGRPLSALDFLKFVDLITLAIADAADALGKQRLEPGVGWRVTHGGKSLPEENRRPPPIVRATV
jgi:hypothetical protein